MTKIDILWPRIKISNKLRILSHDFLIRSLFLVNHGHELRLNSLSLIELKQGNTLCYATI